jgi:hypothetical protein
MEIPNSPE